MHSLISRDLFSSFTQTKLTLYLVATHELTSISSLLTSYQNHLESNEKNFFGPALLQLIFHSNYDVIVNAHKFKFNYLQFTSSHKKAKKRINNGEMIEKKRKKCLSFSKSTSSSAIVC